MRVALVHPYPWPDVRRGAERYLDDLATYLASNDHDVHVVSGASSVASVQVRSDGVTYHRHKHVNLRQLRRIGLSEVETFGAKAVHALRRINPEIVHALTPTGALAGRAVSRPTLYTVLGHPDPAQLPLARLPRWLFISAVRRSNVVAALSQASAGALRSTVGREAAVLPPGVRLERFTPKLEPRVGPPRLLFSGTLADRRKRVDLAIAAFALVLKRHPDARLALSGEGDPKWALETAGRNGRDLPAAIDILGPGTPSDVPARYRDATLTIAPAEHEAFGLALVESLASGTPVVCAPGGGMPEIIGDNAVGSTASATTAEALANSVELTLALAQDRLTPARCVHRAQRWAWDESVGPRHEELYRSLRHEARTPMIGGVLRSR